MKRRLIQRSAMAALLGAATAMAAACSIDDRTVDTDCFKEEGCEGSGGKGSGGKGSGGSASGGEENTGGDESGGTSPGSGGKASGGTGGKASGGTNPGSGGRASGGTSPGSGGAGGVTSATLAQAIQRFAVANCTLAQGCAKFYVSVSFGDEDGCVDQTVFANEWYASLPSATWDKAFYDRCATGWETAVSDSNCTAFYSPTPPAGCRSPGSRANGSPCNAFNQCASYFCKTVGYDCGVCAPQPASGASCTENVDCKEDELCEPDGKCRAPLARNAACGPTTAQCLAPLSCYQGKCVSSPFKAGDACDAANGLFCDRTYGVTCNGTQCVAIPSTTVGGSCPTGTFCLDNASCVSGTCRAGPETGDPCNPDQGINCRWPAVCIGPTNGAWCEDPQDAVLCGTSAAPAPG